MASASGKKLRKQVTLSKEAILQGKRIGRSEKPKRDFSNTIEFLIFAESKRRFAEVNFKPTGLKYV